MDFSSAASDFISSQDRLMTDVSHLTEEEIAEYQIIVVEDKVLWAMEAELATVLQDIAESWMDDRLRELENE